MEAEEQEWVEVSVDGTSRTGLLAGSVSSVAGYVSRATSWIVFSAGFSSTFSSSEVGSVSGLDTA